MLFTSLPVELALLISDFLDLADLNVLARACKFMFRVLDPQLYQRASKDNPRTCRTRILYAALHGKANAITKLWHAGVPMSGFENYTDDYFPPEDILSIGLNGSNAKRRLLEKDVHPFLLATAFGHVEVVRMFLTEGNADIDFQYRTGKTALHYAIENDHPIVIKLLLERGATLLWNSENESVLPPLAFAADVGNRNALEMIVNELDNRSTPDGALKEECGKACQMACFRGYSDIVDFLLRHTKINVNCHIEQRGLLFWAVTIARDLSTVKVLVKHGAKMESERDCGIVDSLFHCKYDEEGIEDGFDSEIFMYLLQSGCNVANGGLHACALWRILNPPWPICRFQTIFIGTPETRSEIIKILLENGFDKKNCRHGCWKGRFNKDLEKKLKYDSGSFLEYILHAEDTLRIHASDC